MHNNAFWSNSNAFSLIICKVHRKRENTGSWNSGLGKAMSDHLHISKWAETSRGIFMEYIRIIGANNNQRGATRWAQPTWAHQAALACPGGLCPPRPTSGAPLLVYKPFWPSKNKGRTFGMKRRRLAVGLGQEHFCPPAGQFCRWNFPPGGGNHRHHHHQQLSHLGEVYVHQHLQHHNLLSNPSSSLVFNLCSGTIDWCLWVTSSVDYIL